MCKKKIYFRVDGNSKIGLGHVYRCLALADILKSDFDCSFMIRTPNHNLKNRIKETAELIELPETNNYLEEINSIAQQYFSGDEIVVLDGYYFDTAYQKVIKNTNAKLVCIDDIHAYHFLADIIINHAGGLTPAIYSKEDYTSCCLGLNYALLQDPFLKAAQNKDYSQKNINSIFVCLGGADPNNDIITVLQKIEDSKPSAHLFVVLGSSYSHKAAFKAFKEQSKLSIHELSSLSANEMVHYMQKSEILICSPSTIAYECLSVGGLSYLYLTADNQTNIFNYFFKTGLAFDFKSFPLLDESKKKESIQLQEELLGGKSSEHLLSLFKTL